MCFLRFCYNLFSQISCVQELIFFFKNCYQQFIFEIYSLPVQEINKFFTIIQSEECVLNSSTPFYIPYKCVVNLEFFARYTIYLISLVLSAVFPAFFYLHLFQLLHNLCVGLFFVFFRLPNKCFLSVFFSASIQSFYRLQ